MPLPDLSRRLGHVEKSIFADPAKFSERYATDPVAYAREILHIRHLTPAQKSILTYIATEYARCKRVRLLVPSGNKLGKSFIAAVIASWCYDCFRPVLTYITSPSKAQVDEVVFRQLRMLRRDQRGFAPKASILSDGPEKLCKGLTAATATAFQGRHEGTVCVIFDEAEEIDNEFWIATESFAKIWVAFYNPTQASSAASIAERQHGWKIIRLSALEHPNIIAGEKGLPPVIPNAITIETLLGFLDQYRCTEILDPNEPWDENDITVLGKRWRLSPIAEARILGRRPIKSSDAVYSRGMLDKLRSREIPRQIIRRWALQIGCDVARYGDDFTVIHVRQGMCSLHHEAHNGWNTDQTARRLRELAQEYAAYTDDGAQEIPILIDEVGIGAGVLDQSKGFKFIGINTCRKPDTVEKELEFPNLRSQIAFDFDDLLRAGYVDLSRLRDSQIHDITEQLSVMTYELGPRGVRMVHPKKEIKERLGRSPDDADAVLLAYYQFPETLEVSR